MTLTSDPPRGSFGPSPRRPLGGIPCGPGGAPRIGARGSTIGTVRGKKEHKKLGKLKQTSKCITQTLQTWARSFTQPKAIANT